MPSRALIVSIALLTYASEAFAQAVLFSDANAYNPVPNASGTKVAYVVMGRGREGGTGGFGRSNVKSLLTFSRADGQSLPTPPIDAFLDRWIDELSVSCYRDWQFSIGSESGLREAGSTGVDHTRNGQPAERVTYLTSLKTFLWLDEANGSIIFQTPNGPLGYLGIAVPLDSLVVPSPDEHYIAVARNGGSLVVYDLKTRKSVDLGRIQIYPSVDWDYLKPTWDPWFRDSSALAFSTGTALYVSTPNGSRIEEVGSKVSGYLPVPSPDGKSIAYVTFVSRPMRLRKDLTFWGEASVWVVRRGQKQSVRVTQPTGESTLDLRWLNGSTIIFDRMSDQVFPEQGSRIWTVQAP